MQAGEGLLIPKCDSVHTVGMKFPIDVLYLGRNGTVVAGRLNMQPGQKAQRISTGSLSVLELPSGGALSTEVGDQIMFTRL
jgi:hypothetical protein